MLELLYGLVIHNLSSACVSINLSSVSVLVLLFYLSVSISSASVLESNISSASVLVVHNVILFVVGGVTGGGMIIAAFTHAIFSDGHTLECSLVAISP